MGTSLASPFPMPAEDSRARVHDVEPFRALPDSAALASGRHVDDARSGRTPGDALASCGGAAQRLAEANASQGVEVRGSFSPAL